MEEDTKTTDPIDQEESETVEEESQVETPVEEIPVEQSIKNPELNCPDCKGEGLTVDHTARCATCGGTGKV